MGIMSFQIWEAKGREINKYPIWLLDTGDAYCDYYGFNDSASLLKFVIKLKGEVNE